MRITAEGYSYAYMVRGFAPIHALDSVTIRDMLPGEIVCIMGPNGAGKSTLAGLVGGYLDGPSSGVLLVDDAPDTASNSIRRLFIPQKPQEGVLPQLTVLENLVFRRKALKHTNWHRAAGKAERQRVLALLNETGFEFLNSKLDLPPEALSGGQQQVLNVLSAIYAEPDLLVLDEPTSKLDEANRIRVAQLVLVAAKTKRAIVFCATHDGEMAERLSDRICTLDRGRLVRTRRVRSVDAKRFVGDVRVVATRSDLPHDVAAVSDDWWAPAKNKLFGPDYVEGDDSRGGYLAGRRLSREQRTHREVNGVLALLHPSPTDRILDIPCGWGRHTLPLQGRNLNAAGGDLAFEFLMQGTRLGT